jgi:predicted DNA-binding transcriptional regulator YafY
MADFATEQEVPVEIQYERTNRDPLVERVLPKKIAGDRIYAFSEKRKRTRSYRLERIQQIRLLGDET